MEQNTRTGDNKENNKERNKSIMRIMNRLGFKGTWKEAEKQLSQEDRAWAMHKSKFNQ